MIKSFSSLTTLALLTVLLLVPPVANAGTSAQWDRHLPNLPFYSVRGSKASTARAWLSNIRVSVEYQVSVTDRTGVVINPNDEVAEGTVLTYKIKAFAPADIQWFATGAFNDSPNGTWVRNAGKPADMCTRKNMINDTKNGANERDNATYAHYTVAPPETLITGLDGNTCSGDAMKQTCTMLKIGTTNARFNFEPTISQMYGAYAFGEDKHSNQCSRGPAAPNKGGEPYEPIPVPAKHIDFPVRVKKAPDTNRAPTLSASGSASCLAGSPFTINMQATDPDNDRIRYLIDWDADGTVDQFVPATGYVNSETESSASRTYSLLGAKAVRVTAEDEHGRASDVVALRFSCEAPRQDAAMTDPFRDPTQTNGPGVFYPSYSNPVAVLSIRAIPSLVKSGRTTKINWNAENVQSCTVTAPNGDVWNTIASAVGGEISRPIEGETIYTLSCIDLDGANVSKGATVRILPAFREI